MINKRLSYRREIARRAIYQLKSCNLPYKKIQFEKVCNGCITLKVTQGYRHCRYSSGLQQRHLNFITTFAVYVVDCNHEKFLSFDKTVLKLQATCAFLFTCIHIVVNGATFPEVWELERFQTAEGHSTLLVFVLFDRPLMILY